MEAKPKVSDKTKGKKDEKDTSKAKEPKKVEPSFTEKGKKKDKTKKTPQPQESDNEQFQEKSPPRQRKGFSYYFNNHTIRGRANLLNLATVMKRIDLARKIIEMGFYLKCPMAGAEEIKGLGKYFNGSTIAGRANVAKATYASIGLLIMYFSLKPKKK